MAEKPKSGRDRILGAAQALFHEQGVAATSVDDIAKAAGVGKGTFYHHFESKDQLVQTIVEALTGFYADRVIPSLARPEMGLNAAWKTLGFSERYLRAQRCAKGCPVGNLAHEVADGGGVLQHKLSELFDTWDERLAVCFERAQADGQLPPSVDPAALASLVLAAYQGATLVTRTTKDLSFYERTTAALRQLVAAAGPGDGRVGEAPATVEPPAKHREHDDLWWLV